ncbi:helix-turn-helix transcriptional regulator [Bradyrhizobium sp. SSBR45G]|uniref:helix-turn-helix domain-containing protein n=1 Tax=unclassified Bradyrhizobium TaxID=2631580 RepID=UPI002342AEAD|nr:MULTISPECIES: helix-turn-helix transcriptional regulator [unclassified Bradyrhizobium]GLH81274.1 helix-turn-helix transcriptional regulator [Bradyrhizobium sp. SSBR45G]GLH88706.1 helix-turn-helix transcriptional regulator [Bradyrhizobium sp. SSBR45R]
MSRSSGDTMETERSETTSPRADRAGAANEVGAAIIHQLNGPLTALLLYLEDLCQNGASFPPAERDGVSLQEVAENALREAESVCRLVQRLGDTFEAPLREQTAFAQGRDIIRWWSRVGNANDQTQPAPETAVRRRSLSTREQEVLVLVRDGYSNKEGAARLQISPRTYEGHRAALMRKFGAKNLADLLRLAARDQDTAESHVSALAGRRPAAPPERCGKVRCRI